MSTTVTRGHRPRAFDHDEAVRLRASGMKLNDIAERMGVSRKSIERVVYPEYGKRQRENARRNAASKRTLCKGGCGKYVWNHYRNRTPSGYCQTCLGALNNVVRHGTETEYGQGCRCDECRHAATVARRERRQRAAA